MQTSDGGYLIGGLSNSLSCNGGYDSWVVKTNSLGVQQWSKCYGGSFDDGDAILGHQYPNGDYLFVGYKNDHIAGSYQKKITRIKSNNIVDWQQTYGGHNSNTSLQSLLVLPDGDIVSAGVDFFDAVILKANEFGDSIWTRKYKYQTATVNNLWDIDSTSDGGFVAIGTTNFGGQDVWIIKVDRFGCLEPGCWLPEQYQIKYENVAGIDEYEWGYFNLYPNPSNGNFNLQYETKTTERVYLNIYDIVGKQIYVEVLSLGNNNKTINTNLPNGIYEWTLISKNQLLKTGKIVIVR